MDQWPIWNGLQRVSIPERTWPRSTRALCIVLAIAFQHVLVERPHALLDRMWLTYYVALGCRLWTNGLYSMCFQRVSVE